ncbi:MAG: transporter [Beijerinckiaceae bacterium]|nr:transporter [Beijerinckiaceae bacterium]
MTTGRHARRIVVAAAGLAAASTTVSAAESAAGAYILGIRGPAAGVTPPTGLFFSSQFYSYGGRISGRIPFEGGSILGSARVRANVAMPTFLLVTPVELLGGRLGVSLTAPYGDVAVRGTIGPLRLADSVTTFADPSVSAFLGWRRDDFHWQLGLTGFLPIGDYRRGELANVAKHRGAVDLFGTLSWIEPTIGIDVSNTLGVTLNRENRATRYRSGTELHWEWSVAKTFANGFSFGPAGYVYQQLSDDTGAGAALGAFKGRVWAVGAGLGYSFKLGALPVTARLRYFHEVESRRRLKGDSVFLSVGFPLWVPQPAAKQDI